jgi:hypothetical protein
MVDKRDNDKAGGLELPSQLKSNTDNEEAGRMTVPVRGSDELLQNEDEEANAL